MNNNENKIPHWLLFFNLALLASCLILVFFIYSALHPQNILKIAASQTPKVAEVKAFDNINLSAKAALVFDLKDNVVVYKNDVCDFRIYIYQNEIHTRFKIVSCCRK